MNQRESDSESAKKCDAFLPIQPSRRSVLGGLGAGLAQTVFRTQLNAARLISELTGEPGKLDFRISAVSPTILHISIAPVHAKPPEREPGILESVHETALAVKEGFPRQSPGNGTPFASIVSRSKSP